jgi:hypothetical protein
MDTGMDVVNVGVSSSSCFFIFIPCKKAQHIKFCICICFDGVVIAAQCTAISYKLASLWYFFIKYLQDIIFVDLMRKLLLIVNYA